MLLTAECSSSSFILFLGDTVTLHWKPLLYRLAGEEAPRSCLLCLPSTGLPGTWCHIRFFKCRCWESKLTSSGLILVVQLALILRDVTCPLFSSDVELVPNRHSYQICYKVLPRVIAQISDFFGQGEIFYCTQSN